MLDVHRACAIRALGGEAGRLAEERVRSGQACKDARAYVHGVVARI